VRLQHTRLLIIATAALGLSAPTAQADTQYGGTGLYKGNQPSNPSISLLRQDNGQIAARIMIGASCRNYANYNIVLRATGRSPDGVSFTASGRGGLIRAGDLRVRLTGTLAADSVTGTARVTYPRRCRNRSYTQPFALRPESAPGGAFAVPAAGTLMQGFTSQTAGGYRLPVSLRVTKSGRVYTVWQALMRCGRFRIPMLDFTPSRRIRANGTFGGTQNYVIRYRGYAEHYRVTFKGQFRADGATGTARTRVYYTYPGKRRSVNCVSGTQTWSARP
jgi:hypothetical protein